MEPFQFAQGLGVVGSRVDHLNIEVVEALFEHHFCAMETAGETQSVVREDLAGQPITGSGQFEGVPRQLPGGSGAGHSSEQIAGVVIDEVNYPTLGAVAKRDLGGVDLPQIVGDSCSNRLSARGRRGGWAATSPLRTNT